MMIRGTSFPVMVLTLFVLAFSQATAVVQAHEPRFHRVRLVRFENPPVAPVFTLPTVAGGSVSLEALRGRYVLLNFWATWCPPCVREMPSMEKLSRHMAEKPLTVLGVALDAEGAAKVKPFLQRLGITFPIALDPQSRSSRAYGASDLPATFLIDPKGRVVLAAKGERDWGSDAIMDYLREVIDAKQD